MLPWQLAGAPELLQVQRQLLERWAVSYARNKGRSWVMAMRVERSGGSHTEGCEKDHLRVHMFDSVCLLDDLHRMSNVRSAESEICKTVASAARL